MESDNTQSVEALSESLENVAEALIFAAESPISAERIASVYETVTGEKPSRDRVEEAVDALNEQYEENERALRIEAWAGGFRMATASRMAPFLKSFFQTEKRTSLSRSLMETVAIIAYRQPVTRPEIEFVRGVSADYAVRKLLDLELIDVLGRSESLGRPLLYGTTDRFLEQFGLNDLDDLPSLREIEELVDEAEFDREEAQQLLEADLDELKEMHSDEVEPSSNGVE